MEIISVRDILKVDTISRSTGAWKELIKLANGTDGGILFDFRGIQLIEPWTNEYFKQLMKNERVHLKVYTAEETKNTIELMLAIGHLKTGRVENEDIMIEYTLTDKEKKVLFAKEQILDNMKMVDGKMSIEIGNIRSFISESITVEGLQLAIEKHATESGIKEFRVGLSGVTITDPMLLKLAELINHFEEQGILVEMTSNEDEVINKIITFQCIGSKQLSARERFEIFKETIRPKTVGMLARYSKTGRLDSLGRMGDGQPIMCRPAIFDGFVKRDGVVHARFTTFPLSTFYTKQDYCLDNDGASLKTPRTEVMYAAMPDIGLCDKFTGREFHFNMPIQLTQEDGYTTYRVKDGNIETIKIILPEYIKRVLDDHIIEYDCAALLDAIVENKKLLKERFGTEF